MRVNGSILLDKNGSLSKISNCSDYLIFDFVSMIEEAYASKDTFYYDSDEWGDFYAKSFSPDDLFWADKQILYSALYISSHPIFVCNPINDANDFDSKPAPRTIGGFKYEGCEVENYVHNKESIEEWHRKWFYDNPDKIEWNETDNGVFPCYNKVIEILREEIKKIKGNSLHLSNLDYQDRIWLERTNIEQLEPKKVVSCFYDFIMSHKDETSERISYAIEIGSEICKINYYHEEKELRRLNKTNKCIKRIFSIKKNGYYQFLSIDVKHGRFELCNDNGEHICEILFSGEKINHSQETDHSIFHVKEWKSIYNK